MGQTDVVDEEALDLLLAYAEWQEGVLSAERPAERAMWRRGRVGREKSSWWVLTKRAARSLQRSWEYMVYHVLVSRLRGCDPSIHLVRFCLGVGWECE